MYVLVYCILINKRMACICSQLPDSLCGQLRKSYACDIIARAATLSHALAPHTGPITSILFTHCAECTCLSMETKLFGYVRMPCLYIVCKFLKLELCHQLVVRALNHMCVPLWFHCPHPCVLRLYPTSIAAVCQLLLYHNAVPISALHG